MLKMCVSHAWCIRLGRSATEERLKVTGTCSWIKLVSHNLPVYLFLPKRYQIFTTTSHYGRHSVIVRHNSKFATVHTWVTVGGCSMEFEYNFLRQFVHAVARRMPYTSVLSICMTLLQGHVKNFCKFSVRCSLFSKLLGTCFSSTQEPFSHSVLFQDTRKNTLCGPVVSCSGSVYVINNT